MLRCTRKKNTGGYVAAASCIVACNDSGAHFIGTGATVL